MTMLEGSKLEAVKARSQEIEKYKKRELLGHHLQAIFNEIAAHPQSQAILADPRISVQLADLRSIAEEFRHRSKEQALNDSKERYNMVLGDLRDALLKYEGLELPKNVE
jgi:hypothetical protein